MARTLPKPDALPRPAHLVAREGALALVAEALDDAEMHGSLLLFDGAAGIGKSRLLAELWRVAEGVGACTLRGRGGELEVGFPFGVARQLFEPCLAAADPLRRAELLASSGAASPLLTGARADDLAAAGDAVLHGLSRLVRRLSEDGVVLLAVDDLQWVDRRSLELLVYLSQRLENLPLVITCTRTSGEPGPNADLADRIESGPVARVEVLAPLDEDGVEEMAVNEGFADATPEFVEAVTGASGGVPFLVKALLASARAAGLSGHDSARVPGLASEPVWRTTALRLERLPEGARALAHAAAVLGSDATAARAAAMAGLDHFTGLEAADTLRRAEILGSSHSTLRFRHGIVRESIYAGLAQRDRAGAHMRAARVLSDEGGGAERTAEHLLRAQRIGEPWATGVLREAGRAALAGGRPERGIAYLRRALDEEPAGPERAGLLAELGEAEAAAGDPAGAAHLALAAEGSQSDSARAQTLERLGVTLWLLGKEGAATEAFERGLVQSEGRDDPRIARMQAGLLMAGRFQPELRERVMGRLGPVLREPGFNRPREPGVLACVAFERALAGRRSTRVSELAERALESGALADPDALPGPECFAACCALVWADSLSTAEIALTMALEAARRRGHAGAAAAASRFRAWTVLQRGRLSHAAADALDSSGAEGYGPTAAVPSSATILAEIDMEQGRLEEAALLLEDPAQHTASEDGPRHAFHLAARGRLHFLRGEHERALEDLLDCGRRLESLGIHNPTVLPWRSRAAIAAAAGHDRARALSLATEEVSLARTFGAPRPLGVALRASALVGAPEDRLAVLREAVECLERSPGALDRARALIDLGGELRRGGQRRDARERLRVGLDLAHRCEASALAARAHEELVAAGARPRRERLSGSEALTPRERQVALLAARGVRNREIAQRLFITQKTVEWHLGNAFRKLELHSRDSLIGALGEESGADVPEAQAGMAAGPATTLRS
jgi:DNA-binding CsgD family transcriptional regulator